MELGASFVHSPKEETNLISKFVEEKNWGKIPGRYGAATYYYENEGLMKNKHIEKAGDLYEQMNSEIEAFVQSSNEDKSLEEVTEEFFKRRVTRQAQQVRKLFESMNLYNRSLEG